ncbi:hypothetical protein G6F62_008005 [Rhizopus arrhizus]|nr:hypothetical protein G6F41_011396 [Rhizopus arrhizus]KAG1328741.1 hypothetical protein G6F62_008005 [Rhizopus arrhizus]
MVESGLLEKIQFTQWGSQVRPVQKPDGTMRVCGNYVAINLVTVPIKYPFPNMHHLLQSLGQAKVFSKLDLAQGYFQIPIKQEHKEKTALVTVNGTYVFTVMPMGMKNAPAVFQSLMDKVLGSFRYSFAFAYQDDIIVYSRSVDEHKQHLCQVLTQLKNANLSIKLSKSQFCLDTVEYLGFIVSKEGVSASPDKIKPILNYETPTSLTELERFLGMTGVYQRFISQYQIKTEPLRRLKKKDTPFIWSKEQQQAFDSLKEELCLLPTLKQPDFSRPFELHTDAATSAGIAVILCQKHDNTPYPLAYASRALTIHEQRYSVREQECLSIIFGIKKFRPFLERKTFYIYTDHSSLQWIQNVKDDVTPRIWRWTMFLQSYQFEIIHVPGRLNSAADALSRHSVAMSNIQVLTSITDNIDWSKLQDEDASLYEIKNNIDQHELYVVIHNILYISKPNKDSIHHNDLYLVVPDQAIQDICRLFHSSPLGGHFGAKKTKAKITQQSLWWNNMGEDIKQYCKSCDLCQRIKGSKSNNYNISNTSKDFPFFRVALDFFGPLPTSLNQNSHILVVIDCFSRYVEIYPVKSTTQEELAKTFFDRFILRHGVPQEILSDGGPPFNSMFFAQLSTLLGSKQLLTPPWHPQSNGIVERFMLTLRRMILTYTDQAVIKTEWDQHLRILQFVYNSTQHEGTGFAPFYLVHGRHPKAPLVNLGDQKIYEHYQSPSQQFTLDLQNRLNLAFEIVDNNLNNNEYKNKENPFQVNEKVLLFNQSLSSSKKPRKLMFDWLGPFIVTNLNSKSVVNLKDTLSNKTVLNVHISRLKKFIEPV